MVGKMARSTLSFGGVDELSAAGASRKQTPKDMVRRGGRVWYDADDRHQRSYNLEISLTIGTFTQITELGGSLKGYCVALA